MRMIDRVHRNAAVMRHLAHPALAAGLPQRDIFVIHVSDLPDGRLTLLRNPPDLTRRQFQQRQTPFSRNQLRLRSRRARHLPAFAWPQFDVMDDGAGRNIFQWKGIAYQNVSLRP